MIAITNGVLGDWLRMVERLTEDDWRRIEAFAATPAYAREPEQLLPEDAETDDDGEQSARPTPLADGGGSPPR